MRRFDRLCLHLASGIALAALGGLASAQSMLQIVPGSPRYQEPVYARINFGSAGHCIYGAQVSMTGVNNITISDAYIIDICSYSYDVELGRFPSGNYTVQLLNPTGQPVTAQFTVGPPPSPTSYPGTVPAVNYSGMWWNALESGWGLSISQGPTHQFFAVWFVYDAAGLPTWYTLEMGGWTRTNVQTVYTGSVYRYMGPHFATAFDASMVAGTLVGTGSLMFRSATTGRFDYTIDGTSGFKEIVRMPVD